MSQRLHSSITNAHGTLSGDAPFYNSRKDGEANAPVYGTMTGENEWVYFSSKNMVQLGTWTTGSTEQTCTKMYEQHYSLRDRTTWEADPNMEILTQVTVVWRNYGYCCSGIFPSSCFVAHPGSCSLNEILGRNKGISLSRRREKSRHTETIGCATGCQYVRIGFTNTLSK